MTFVCRCAFKHVFIHSFTSQYILHILSYVVNVFTQHLTYLQCKVDINYVFFQLFLVRFIFLFMICINYLVSLAWVK